MALEYADHQARMYKFSNFLPNSKGKELLSHGNETSKLWHEIFVHMNNMYIQALNKDEMVEGIPSIKSYNGACIGQVVGKHPERSYEKGNKRGATQTLVLVHLELIGNFSSPSYG